MMAQMNRGGLFGQLGKKMMGGLAGGLGGMLGGGLGMPGMLPGTGEDIDHGDGPNGSQPRSGVKKKKRHKKKR